MAGILVHLGHLVFIHTAFNSKRVQPKRCDKGGQLLAGGIEEIQPDESITLPETESLIQKLDFLDPVPGCDAEVAACFSFLSTFPLILVVYRVGELA